MAVICYWREVLIFTNRVFTHRPALKSGSIPAFARTARTLKRPIVRSALQRACNVSAGVYAGAILALALIFLGSPSPAQDKSGVSPSAISLPNGPGSIEGLGASFEPQLNTGTAAQSFSVLVPPGVAGHQPNVSFSYDSGSGNGPLGIGWSSSMPEISRQTDKGAPQYTGANADPATEDTFLFGGEELVPLSDGTYRCENESQFVRFRKIAAMESGPVVAWEGTQRNGNRMLFGLSSAQRVTRTSGDPESFADSYCWKLALQIDVNGNSIHYTYESFAPESNGMLYCTQIEYAKFGNDVHHRILFVYSGSTAYPDNRTDVFSDYRPGFEVRTSKLLREIAVYTDGDLVRRYVLDYEPDPSLVISAPGDVDLGFNLLQKVTQFDRSETNQNYLPPLTMAYSRFHTQSVAQKELKRVGFDSAKGIARPEFQPVTGGNNFLRFGPTLTEVADINSDGLPDFISSGENRWFAYLNKGGGTFSGEVLFEEGAADGKRLDEAAITLADLDGDGVTDLFQKNAVGDRFLTHRNLNGFGEPTNLDETEVVRWGAESTFSDETGSADFGALAISDPSLQRIDLNFDKRIDVMRPFDFGDGTGGVEYLYNLPGADAVSARWTSETLFTGDPRLPGDWVSDEARFDGHDPAFRSAGLADLNGDRLLDWYTLAVVGDEVWIDYWPNSNGGAWANRRSMVRLELPGILADDLVLLDVNTDGLNDLVRVDNNLLTFWVNVGADQWSDAIVRNDAPPFIKNQTVLRRLDVNGNGTTDLFWDNSALPGKGTQKGFSTYTYFDFVGELKPNLMQVIDNGIGLRTLIEYRSSTDFYLDALASGDPWTIKLPFPVNVVSRVTESIGLDLNGDSEDDEYITDFSYFDGYYDSFEKEFRGFAYAEEIERGDDFDSETGITTPAIGSVHAPSLVRRHRFLTGSPDGADNDDYTDGYSGARATDEGSGTGSAFTPNLIDEGGREEECLKGNPVMVEEIDPAALVAPSNENAGFYACARASALAAMTDPFGIEAQRCAPNRYVYNRSLTDWRIRRLYRPSTLMNPPGRFADGDEVVAVTAMVGKSVNFAFTQTSDGEIYEANGYLQEVFDGDPVPYPLRNRILIRTVEDYDDYGNQILNADYGIVEPSSPEGLSVGNDERIMRTTFALGGEALERWIISSPSSVRVGDENGVFASEVRSYYDGKEFEGLPIGEVGSRGLLKRTENVVTEDPATLASLEEYDADRIDRPGDPRLPGGSFIVSSRVAHDTFGNVIGKVDPLGDPNEVNLLPNAASPTSALPQPGNGGHIGIIAFDETRHVFPVEERFVIGNGAEDLVLTAEYDPGFGTLLSMTDFNGHTTAYEYDSFARLVRTLEPGDTADRPTTQYFYRPGDSQRNLVYEYDDAGNLTGGAPQGSPPPVANAVETRAREDVSSSLDYNTLDSLSYTSGKGQELLKALEDEVAGRWVIEQATLYNLRGTPQATVQPYYRNDSIFHPPGEGGIRHDGNPISETDRTDSFLDAMGRPVATLNPPETFGGPRSRGITQYLPLEKRYFDEEDAVPSSPHFNTPSSEIQDGLGRTIAAVESTRLNDDGTMGTEVREWSTRFLTDLNDQIVSIEDSQGNIRWMRYDGLGRRIFMNDPNRGSLTEVFDDASNLVERVDAKDQRTTYTYDGLNRILTEDYHDAGFPFSYNREYDPASPLSEQNLPDVRYVYDAPEGPVDFGDGRSGVAQNTRGDLAAVIDLSGEEHFSYDDRGRRLWKVKRIKDPLTETLVSFRTQMSYDSLSRLTEMTYPDGDRVRYEYDSRGMLESVIGAGGHNRDNSPQAIASVEYTPSGQLLRQSLGNGIVQEYDYDPRLRSTSIRAIRSFSPESPVLNYEYDFDRRSNVLAIRDQLPATSRPAGDSLRNHQTFTYDDLYRVTRVGYSFSEPGSPPSEDAQVTYRYDRLGNMLEKSSSISETDKGIPLVDLGEMSYGGTSGRSDRIGRAGADPGPHALTSSSNAGEIEYDANGNLTRFGDFDLTWDFVDRLWAIEDTATRVECDYDFSDTRVVKSVAHKDSNGAPDMGHPDISFYIDSKFEMRGDRAVKFVTNGDALFARAVGTLDPTAARVQRIRLQEGWNHIAIQVETDDLPGQLESATNGGVDAIYRWNPDDHSFELFPGEESAMSGSVYAVLSSAAAVVPVTGEYKGPVDRAIIAGGGFVAPTGLEGNDLTEDLSGAIETAWAHNAATGIWPARYSGEASPLSKLPDILPPSVPLFTRSPSAASLSRPASAEGIHYYISDHLGSSNALCDGIGEIVEETVFFPFGHPRSEALNATAESKSLGRYLFEQKELDEETGLQYFEARYLSGPLSRFISVDPEIDPRGLGENPQLLNPYAYGANNPITEIDPDGRIITIEGTRKYKRTVKETLKRLESESPDAKKLIQGLNNDKRFKVTISYSGPHNNSFSPKERNFGRVRWDPTSALLFDKQTVQNGRVENTQYVHHSALGLAHELGHADGWRQDPHAYDNRVETEAPGGLHDMEEARAIIQVEGPIASQLGLPTRPHHGGFQMTSKGPFSLLSKTPPPLPPRPTEKFFSVRSFKPAPKRRGGGVFKPVKPVKKGGRGGAKSPPKGRGGKK